LVTTFAAASTKAKGGVDAAAGHAVILPNGKLAV
jgi:hypothetical protein